KSLILHFARGPSQGTLYGGYYMIRDTVVTAGALLGGLLWTIAPELNLVTASLFGAAGTTYFVLKCRE
ncbi:MAG: MFS transporter, partial [Betaproteobacteria bacterium]|nr:MFS transporter [Betaproteobacteria bacterium]